MKRLLFAIMLLASALLPAAAHADTIVYVHGWLPAGNDLSADNNTSRSRYPWGQTLPNAIHVNWNTGVNWVYGVNNAKTVFDSRCLRSAGQSCTVICHSTGCAISSAALDIYGTTNGVPRWNINRVMALASAEGGSELSTPGFMANVVLSVYGFSGVVANSVMYLDPSYVRGYYDHQDTAGTAVFHVAGYDGTVFSAILPGQDDGIVAFHSACGYTKVFSSTLCSNDWEWVRKTSWGIPYYVMRTVSQWTNHKRVEWCGRDGCDKMHMQLVDLQFQNLALVANP